VETSKQKQKALRIAGEELIFTGGTLRGFPGFSRSKLYNGQDSVYGTDVQEFEFQIDVDDMRRLTVGVDTTFTYLAASEVYTFRVLDMLPDAVGWVILRVILETKVDA